MCRAGFARDVPEQAGKDHAQQHRENAAVEIQHPETGAARVVARQNRHRLQIRSEEHTSELQSLMRISYAVFCLKKKNKHHGHTAMPLTINPKTTHTDTPHLDVQLHYSNN